MDDESTACWSKLLLLHFDSSSEFDRDRRRDRQSGGGEFKGTRVEEESNFRTSHLRLGIEIGFGWFV